MLTYRSVFTVIDVGCDFKSPGSFCKCVTKLLKDPPAAVGWGIQLHYKPVGTQHSFQGTKIKKKYSHFFFELTLFYSNIFYGLFSLGSTGDYRTSVQGEKNSLVLFYQLNGVHLLCHEMTDLSISSISSTVNRGVARNFRPMGRSVTRSPGPGGPIKSITLLWWKAFTHLAFWQVQIQYLLQIIYTCTVIMQFPKPRTFYLFYLSI